MLPPGRAPDDDGDIALSVREKPTGAYARRMTIREDLPREVDYLERHDDFSARAQEEVADMPDGTVDLLTRFLSRNQGRLSRRARRGGFRLLTAPEVERVEAPYAECFADAEFR